MEENWVVFPSSVQDEFSIFSINTGLANAAPLESHPYCHWIILDYKKKGFPEPEMEEKLAEFEDKLITFLQGKKGAYVGRFTSVAGTRQYFFYLPKVLLDELKTFVEAARPPYDLRMNLKEDPEWQLYLEFLYPSPLDWQRIHLQQVLSHLREAGDLHEVHRNIDHYAYFETENGAKAFIEYLEQNDFSTIEESQKEEGMWNVSFKQYTSVEVKVLEPIVMSLFKKAASIGGTYDGWGSPVVKTPGN